MVYPFNLIMNIFLSWDSSWIWKALFEKLSIDNNVFWVSRNGQIKADLTQNKDIDLLINKLENIKFDVIILNAGKGYFWNFEDGDLETYEEIINLNLLANIKLLKKLNYDKNKTKIIFIWSIISKKFMKWASVYQASKFWLRWLAWWLKNEWYKVFFINPKIVDTNFHPKNMDLTKFPQTSIESIVNVVKNIIKWKEKRFEIDL